MTMDQKERNHRKTKEGTVVSLKMEKTAIVRVTRKLSHAMYGKVITRSKKYYAHDEQAQQLKVGQKVQICECKPISKLKRWRVVHEQKG